MPASAATVSVRVEGKITNAPDALGVLPPELATAQDDSADNDPSYVLEYHYETETGDLDPTDLSTGEFLPTPASLRFWAPGLEIQCGPPDGLRVLVFDDTILEQGSPVPEDALVVDGLHCESDDLVGATVELASAIFLAPLADAIDSDALPTAPPSLADWPDAAMAVAGCPEGQPACTPETEGYALAGSVTFVPEPGELALGGAALSALALLALARDRRRA